MADTDPGIPARNQKSGQVWSALHLPGSNPSLRFWDKAKCRFPESPQPAVGYEALGSLCCLKCGGRHRFKSCIWASSSESDRQQPTIVTAISSVRSPAPAWILNSPWRMPILRPCCATSRVEMPPLQLHQLLQSLNQHLLDLVRRVRGFRLAATSCGWNGPAATQDACESVCMWRWP
jgi:hypothetical protein